MSYARRGSDSDVYVYATRKGHQDFWVCSSCDLAASWQLELQEGAFVADTRAGMLKHLEEHVGAGYRVGEAIERLRREIGEGQT